MAVAEPKVLWTPSEERIERATLTRYMRWLEEKHGLGSSTATTTCGAGRCSTSRRSGARSSSSSGCASPRAASACSGSEVMPGARGSRARGCQLCRARVRRQGPVDALAIQHASESRELARLTWGELRAETAAIAAGLRALGRGRGRSGRGVHAEHPRDGGGVPGLRVDRRRVVVGRAGVRRAQRDRPVLADRAQGAAGGRRLPVRRQGLRPGRGGLADRRRDPLAGARRTAGLPGRIGLGGRLPGLGRTRSSSRRCRSTTRCGSCTRSGTTGLPKPIVHGPGRDPARAAEEGASAPRCPARRPDVLVHDDRLDDVELHRRGAAERRVDRPVRREPGLSVAGDVCGTSRRTAG